MLRPVAALGRRAHRPQGRRVQGRPRAGPALPRRRVRHPLQRRRDRRDRARPPPTPTTRPTIFFCGRHEERKGLAVLLEAFGALPDRRRGCGSPATGPTTAALRPSTPATTRIAWLGRISDAEKFARLRGADVFCAPSLHGESFGVVLIEAMAAGTPVVASGLDGYRNVATDGVDALLVEPGDVDALAAALARRARRRGAGRRAARRRAPAGRGLRDAHPRRRVRPHLPRAARAADGPGRLSPRSADATRVSTASIRLGGRRSYTRSP